MIHYWVYNVTGKMVKYRMNDKLKITHLTDENSTHKLEKGLLIFQRIYNYNNISQPMNNMHLWRMKIIRYIKLLNYESKNKTYQSWITKKTSEKSMWWGGTPIIWAPTLPAHGTGPQPKQMAGTRPSQFELINLPLHCKL